MLEHVCNVVTQFIYHDARLFFQLGTHEVVLSEEELETHTIAAWKHGKIRVGENMHQTRHLHCVSITVFWFRIFDCEYDCRLLSLWVLYAHCFLDKVAPNA